jgi:hypothetical protein
MKILPTTTPSIDAQNPGLSGLCPLTRASLDKNVNLLSMTALTSAICPTASRIWQCRCLEIQEADKQKETLKVLQETALFKATAPHLP